MRVKLAGKRYKIVLSDFTYSGECDSPETKDKKIRLKRGLRGLFLLDTIVHESLHACLWMADEEGIAQTASDIAKVLWRLGYRRQDSKSCTLKFEAFEKESSEPSKVVEVESKEQKD